MSDFNVEEFQPQLAQLCEETIQQFNNMDQEVSTENFSNELTNLSLYDIDQILNNDTITNEEWDSLQEDFYKDIVNDLMDFDSNVMIGGLNIFFYSCIEYKLIFILFDLKIF